MYRIEHRVLADRHSADIAEDVLGQAIHAEASSMEELFTTALPAAISAAMGVGLEEAKDFSDAGVPVPV